MTEDGWDDFVICIIFISTNLPTYLYEVIPPIINSYCNSSCYRNLYCRTTLFRNYFLPFSISEWNKMDPDIKNLDAHAMFRRKLWNFVRSSEKTILNISDPQRSGLVNKLRLGFSHSGKHKFGHNFPDTVNPLCLCALETESTDHIFHTAKIMYHFAKPLWMN